jgi:very-short-patch-repair endonuclease
MRAPLRGAFIAISTFALAGCFAPMTTREAQDIANTRLTKYCNGRCGAVTLGRTQKIKDRWLVDFEAPRQKFTVIVENDGNSKVTVWDKSRDVSGQ